MTVSNTDEWSNFEGIFWRKPKIVSHENYWVVNSKEKWIYTWDWADYEIYDTMYYEVCLNGVLRGYE